MNKKKLNIFLLFIVVLIWGFVIQKVIFNLSSKKDTITIVNPREINIKYAEFEKDTFLLKINDRDPFLNKGKTKTKRVVKSKKSTNQKIEVKKKQNLIISSAKWPKIKYLGFINSNEKLGRLALLRIDNKLRKIRIGRSEEGVQVVKIYKDSIEIRYNKTVKIIRK